MTTATSLAAELSAYAEAFKGKAGPEIVAMMHKATEDLRASGIVEKALKTGGKAPDFTLPDATGAPVSLSTLLAAGPVVVSFYRGGWCPYCNLELKALQRTLPAFAARGASLVAISPQTPDSSLSTAQKNELSYPVLSDVGSRVAAAFGLVFTLPPDLQALYTRFGIPLPETNGDDSWQLPVPATYVIGRDGIVALAFVDPSYQVRLEPADILAALDRLPTPA